jgi:hypothetical protein
MLLTQGKTKGFDKLPWAQLELASDARLEEIVLHLVRWVRKRDEAFRILFPIETRDLGGVVLFYPNILIQCRDLRVLKDIRTVMGVQGVTMANESTPLEIPSSFGEQMIAKSEQVSEGWSDGIKKGSFVRILLGERRMLCGNCISVDRGIADIRISLTTRNLRVRIPVRALLKLEIPKEKRRYYYNG